MIWKTIVADPPWPYPGKPRHTGTWPPENAGAAGAYRSAAFDYPTMSLAEIAALPVSRLAENDASLYLWTTQRFLRDAYAVVDAWGFRTVGVLVWSKPPKGMAGDYVCSAEFVLYGKRGKPKASSRHMGSVFHWSRSKHSTKPEAFQDIVEQVSPGPYLELFARRARPGWDCWGDECPDSVELPL